MCQHAHTDKYGHKREDTKGQRVKIVHQHSDVDGKAAASTNGSGVTKSVENTSQVGRQASLDCRELS